MMVNYFLEKMGLLFIFSIWIFIIHLIALSNQECVFMLDNTFLCNNTNPDDLNHDLMSVANFLPTGLSHNYSIKIEDSHYHHIYKFTPSPLKKYGLKRLIITNSFVEIIENGAFESLLNLEELDLSNNQLRTYIFNFLLSKKFKKISLSGNYFNTVPMFSNCYNYLQYLDLSNCNLTYINLNYFQDCKSLSFINISHNLITSFDIRSTRINEIDASFNHIKNYYTGINLYFTLNISHNNIQEFVPTFSTYMDLSYNNILKFSIGNIPHHLNLSNSNITINALIGFLNMTHNANDIDLSGNNLSTIKSYMFKKNYSLRNLILTNSKIANIDSNAFNGFGCIEGGFLYLNFNPIKNLKDHTFNYTCFKILDISHCFIEKIEQHAFSQIRILKKLILSHNNISYLNKEIFKNLGIVEKIDLSYNHIFNIDNVVANSTIMNLDLTNNKISDVLFSSFVNISHNVTMSGNNIPTLKYNKLYCICNVKALDLSQSNISLIESRAFLGLSNLVTLNLRNNYITNVTNDTFKDLYNLKYLDLGGNKIRTIEPYSFMFDNQLRNLIISFDSITLKRKSFIKLIHLKNLTIIDTNFTELEKDSFKGLINLVNLHFNNVIIKKIGVGTFKGLYSLSSIDCQTLFKKIEILKRGMFEGLRDITIAMPLSNLNIYSMEAESFLGLENLQSLSLHKNKITVIVSGTFLNLISLQTLDLSSNKISHFEVKAFAGLKSLTKLSLRGNKLTNITLGTFQKFPNLKIMDLSGNSIPKFVTGTFTNLKSLEELDLSYNNLFTLKMKDLFSLTNLRRLDLTGNHLIEIKYLELLKSLRQLEFIGLNNNKWKCNNLTSMLIGFQNYSINWLSEKEATYDQENIDGIECIDICKFFYCVDGD